MPARKSGGPQAGGVVVLEDGSLYRLVVSRLQELRELHPEVSVVTEEIADAGGQVCFKASILGPDGRVWATGHAEERRGNGEVNMTSALENTETSAIGRALVFLGFLGSDVIREPVLRIDGRPYELVASRILRFRSDHPDWGVETDLYASDATRVKIRARVVDEGGRVRATGHAELSRGTNPNGKDLEECEISAVGRALAVLGYALGNSLASAEEVLTALRLQGKSPRVERVSAPPAAPVPRRQASAGRRRAPAHEALPAESGGFDVAEWCREVMDTLVRAGFVDVTGLPQQESQAHPNRFRLRRTRSGGYGIEARGDAEVLRGLGFQPVDDAGLFVMVPPRGL